MAGRKGRAKTGKSVVKKSKNTVEEKLQTGKGVDIGTAFVKCAMKKEDDILFRSQRNAFFEIENNDFTRKMLDNSRVKYMMKESNLYVVGDEALEFANMFNRNTRRPLSRGVISPTEKEALPMIELIIKSVIGEPVEAGEVAYFSIPGEPVDADFNVIYHEKILEGFLKSLGYTPKPINEGHAVIFSELAGEEFTGLGLSFGGGMVNVCLSFMSVPVLKFSVAKSGDWIDQQVSMAVNETASRVSAIKEADLDLSRKKGLTKAESALSIYYNHLIEYVIENIKDAVSRQTNMPNIPKPLSVILSGGTSLPKGFAGRFREVQEQLKLPFPVGDVRMASQPLRSVAKGALVAASAE